MVLYHADGRVIKAHENYLEREAAKLAAINGYDEQIEECKRRDPDAHKNEDRVYIIVEKQKWATLYAENGGSLWEYMPRFRTKKSNRFPEKGIDRATLMRCSTHADDFFRYKPNATELYLPIKYPRRHDCGTYAHYKANNLPNNPTKPYPFPEDWRNLKYRHHWDKNMAYVRQNEIVDYIVPWLQEMEHGFKKAGTKNGKSKQSEEGVNETGETKVVYNPKGLPQIYIPEDLLGKIHLYNVMLQLGIPSFAQQPLIDSLVAQMYRTNLNACELETLEMTVGRFYSHGVPVLDPVLCHFIGTYPLRRLRDRQNVEPLDLPPEEPYPSDSSSEDDLPEDADSTPQPAEAITKEDSSNWYLDEQFDFTRSDRRYLEFAKLHAGRSQYPNDTFVLPPKLPVLGHSIRHWSGIRRNGSTAAAHNGLPLNVGRVLKYYRRHPTHRIHPKPDDDPKYKPDATDGHEDDPYHDDVLNSHYVEYSSHRLSRLERFKTAPGVKEDTPPRIEPTGPTGPG